MIITFQAYHPVLHRVNLEPAQGDKEEPRLTPLEVSFGNLWDIVTTGEFYRPPLVGTLSLTGLGIEPEPSGSDLPIELPWILLQNVYIFNLTDSMSGWDYTDHFIKNISD